MKRVGLWLWAGLLTVAAILYSIVLLHRPKGRLKTELEAIQAHRKIDRVAAKESKIKAYIEVEKKYAAELFELDAEARQKAHDIGKTPGGLAAYVVREAARRKRKRNDV